MKPSHIVAILALLGLSASNAFAVGPVKGAVIKGGKNPSSATTNNAQASGESGSIPMEAVNPVKGVGVVIKHNEAKTQNSTSSSASSAESDQDNQKVKTKSNIKND